MKVSWDMKDLTKSNVDSERTIVFYVIKSSPSDWFLIHGQNVNCDSGAAYKHINSSIEMPLANDEMLLYAGY